LDEGIMKKTATTQQIQLAEKLGIKIPAESFLISSAIIEDEVGCAISSIKAKAESTEPQRDYAVALGIDVSNDSKNVACAKIQERLDEINKKLIKRHGLAPGKRVYWNGLRREMVISSIAANYRLWFKGGNGWGAFPSQITPINEESSQSI
jgi:hypothetical protein